MTKENNELREKIKAIEGVTMQYLHSQPENDDDCNRYLLKALAKIADMAGDYRGLIELEAYDIEWDTDGEEVDLPDKVRLMLHSEEDFGSVIADRLSDRFGWCVRTFQFRMI